MKRKLKVLETQQGPTVEEARAALDDVLARDTYLQTRIEGFTVERHQKAIYSVYRCQRLPLLRNLLIKSL